MWSGCIKYYFRGILGNLFLWKIKNCVCGVFRDGLKATNIIKAAKEFGLESKGYAKSIEKLDANKKPGNHFLEF